MAIIEMPNGVTPSTIPEYATPNEWAEAFNVSLRTVYRMCKDGELMTVRTPGSIRICRDMYITSWTEFETVPRYCPWCGEDLADD
jgi:excisionase family DNA binding protein